MLSLQWLKKALKDANISFPESFINQVFFHYDIQKKACIDCAQLIEDIVGHLSPSALELVEIAFDSIDILNEGKLGMDILAQKYDAHNHPEVTSSRRSADDEYKDFITCLEIGAETSQKVTKHEFVSYHEAVALVCPDEESFVKLIRGTWNLSDDIINNYRTQKSALDMNQQHGLKTQNALERFPVTSPKARSPYLPNRKDPKVVVPEDDPRGGVPFLLKRIRSELQNRGFGGILNFYRVLR